MAKLATREDLAEWVAIVEGEGSSGSASSAEPMGHTDGADYLGQAGDVAGSTHPLTSFGDRAKQRKHPQFIAARIAPPRCTLKNRSGDDSMKCHVTPLLAAIALLAISFTATDARAQGYPDQGYAMPGYGANYGGYQPGYQPDYAAYQAGYVQQAGGYGNPAYGDPAYGGMMPAAAQHIPGDPMSAPVYDVDLVSHRQRSRGCSTCGGGGCQQCGQGGYGDLCQICGGRGCNQCRGVGFCGRHGPYCDGGCCHPRWWDFYADGLYLKRDDEGRTIPISSDGVSGPTVLQSNDFDLDYEYGFRFGAALMIGVGTNIEFQYMGTLHWNDTTRVTSGGGTLYSAFSNFGTDAQIANAIFDDTEQATLHEITYASDLNTFELNWRKRMVSPNCRIHTSVLAGVRHAQLDEEFIFYSEGRSDTLNYFVGTSNEMTGFQMGGDVWFCLHPRMMVGCDIKAGVYGNHADQVTVLQNGTGNELESFTANDVAFLGESNVTCIFKLTPRWTLRSGVQVLYLEGVALANENFNPTESINGRTVTIYDSGSAFYFGGFGGLEFLW